MKAISNAKGRIRRFFILIRLIKEKIQRVIDIAIKQNNKKIAIIGRRRAQRIVDIRHSGNELFKYSKRIFNRTLRYIDDKNKKMMAMIFVALVTGNRHEPFYMLQRMCKKADRLIHISEITIPLLSWLPQFPGY